MRGFHKDRGELSVRSALTSANSQGSSFRAPIGWGDPERRGRSQAKQSQFFRRIWSRLFVLCKR